MWRTWRKMRKKMKMRTDSDIEKIGYRLTILTKKSIIVDLIVYMYNSEHL